MKLTRPAAATVIALLTLTACGGATPSHPKHIAVAADSIVVPAATPTPTVAAVATAAPTEPKVQPPVAPPSCPGGPSVHFDTPKAAMTYLASAWNRNDLAQLCQVTNPNARFLLNDMHRQAVNLRLKSCQQVTVGQYSCTFVHDYPARMHARGHGEAYVLAESADSPGWYMSNYVGCG